MRARSAGSPANRSVLPVAAARPKAPCTAPTAGRRDEVGADLAYRHDVLLLRQPVVAYQDRHRHDGKCNRCNPAQHKATETRRQRQHAGKVSRTRSPAR